MTSTTYGDLIDEKITEWQNTFQRIEKVFKNDSEASRENISKLKEAMTNAVQQLQELDKKENAGNTVEIKNQILAVFDSIDRQFITYTEKTPFML